MKFDQIASLLDGVPYISRKHAKVLYDFILDTKPNQLIQLGFAYGAASCYMAAALDELGGGRLTAVDLVSSRGWRKPCIEDILSKTGLQKYITVAYENTSYNWFLKKKIEERSSGHNCEPFYDFCYVDGSKNWGIDGLSFFLCDKLLKEQGWILFDDLKWVHGPKKRDKIHQFKFDDAGEDELNTAHIDLIFRLLVMQHPYYAEFKIQDDWWAWARKVQSDKKTLSFSESHTIRTLSYRYLRGLHRKWQGLK